VTSPSPGSSRGATLLTWGRALFARVQDRWRFADRLVRTVDRYLDVQGSLLSAGMTYYGFLALFPLVAVGLGVTSLLARIVPSVDQTVRDQITQLMPSVDVDAMVNASLTVGLIGLGVMLYAGVRWVGALRRSLTLLAGRPPRSVPYLRGLLGDTVVLALLGAAVLASIALSLVTQLATGVLSGWLGTGGSSALVRSVTLIAALLTDLAIGWALYHVVDDPRLRGRRLLVTAAVAGLGFEVLKQAGALIVEAASHNVIYGTFAATVGVLIWISYLCKWILFVGAWALVREMPVQEIPVAGTVPSEPGAAAGGDGHPGGEPVALPPSAQPDEPGDDGQAARQRGGHPQGRGQG
jgi:membrane protein